MRRNPEVLAWAILLASFFTCLTLSIATPLSVRWYVRNSRIEHKVILEVQRGPLSVTDPDQKLPVSVPEGSEEIQEDTVIASDATSGRIVVLLPQPENGSSLVSVQIYEETEVALLSARSPRFSASPAPHRVILEVRSGRVRVNIPGETSRPTQVEVRTRQGNVTMQEGRYAVETDQERAQVTVQEGLADLGSKAGANLRLSANARAVMANNGEITGPLPAARDLIVDGDFSNPLDGRWESYSRDIQIEGEPGGEAQRTEIEGRSVIAITREGKGHAETGVRQRIGTNIRDFNSLELHLMLRIEGHSLPVCGSLGSECPVMVRIDYKDVDGGEQEWLQGFYSRPNTGNSSNPTRCVRCAIRNEHIQVPEDTWYSYDSPNLIPLLSQDGQGPTMINSITIYASGHTYKSQVAEVELIGEE